MLLRSRTAQISPLSCHNVWVAFYGNAAAIMARLDPGPINDRDVSGIVNREKVKEKKLSRRSILACKKWGRFAALKPRSRAVVRALWSDLVIDCFSNPQTEWERSDRKEKFLNKWIWVSRVCDFDFVWAMRARNFHLNARLLNNQFGGANYKQPQQFGC